MLNEHVDQRYYESAQGTVAQRILIRARQRMYDDLIAFTQPTAGTRILDIGASDVLGEGANFFEEHYPHLEDVHAVGLGTARDFQAAFPAVTYTQITPQEALPFPSRSFDLAISNAVLEHVGSVEAQRAFVAEAMRVADLVFLTVPHRFFPVEHHTRIPFAHWSDRTFRLACRFAGKHAWAEQEELILMSARRLRSVVPDGVRRYAIGRTGLRAGIFSSNLYLVVDNREPGGRR